ncbi:MAG: phage holin family protein [Thermoanaerobaculia bacterium]
MAPESTPHEETGWKRSVRDRLGAFSRAAASLVETRVAIFREEVGAKAGLLARAAVGLWLALALAGIALLLAAALLTALLAHLFGSTVAGLSGALLLCFAAAAVAGLYGWRVLLRVRPTEFPLTAGEIRKDWQTVAPSAGRTNEGSESEDEESGDIEDLAERFRAGSE